MFRFLWVINGPLKILLLTIGKLRSRPVEELVEDYKKRINHYLPFEIKVCRDERTALSQLEPNDFFVALDERGKEMSSDDWAKFIENHKMRGTKRMVFLIGGQDGISEPTKKRAGTQVSLAKMTLPHELAQVVVSEQIYRACTIIKGEPYHRK
jgi:23S rRNA (pseudouridine1915-N3)-methyltransferase